MRSIKFGYKVENGKMLIHEEEAEIVRNVFDAYLSGMALKEIGEKLGFSNVHGAAGGILKCRKYLGDDIYPKIIDEDVFQKAQELRHEKAVNLGRYGRKSKKDEPIVVKNFVLASPKENYKNPVKKAEYLYGLIRKEE